MMQTLILEIPDDVHAALVRWAQQQAGTPEALAAEYLTLLVQSMEKDPLLKWAGSIESDLTDVAERHDYYIGEALLRESRGEPDA
jgi:hypothetical protein